jgi:hypothetical protein
MPETTIEEWLASWPGKMTSGRVPHTLTWTGHRAPACHDAWRSSISGPVSLERTRRMTRLKRLGSFIAPSRRFLFAGGRDSHAIGPAALMNSGRLEKFLHHLRNL